MVPKSCRQDPDPCNGNTWQRNTVDTKLESLESPMKSHEVPSQAAPFPPVLGFVRSFGAEVRAALELKVVHADSKLGTHKMHKMSRVTCSLYLALSRSFSSCV